MSNLTITGDVSFEQTPKPGHFTVEVTRWRDGGQAAITTS